jgi:hypothetical protein
MPSLNTARQISAAKNNGAKTIGQIHKENSDFVMEETFWNDPQSRVCYIYDYYHDDQPSLKDHMTYEHTTKTRIDAKFIIKSYRSLDKDQVEYYLQFRPSQKLSFNENDELYYFETDYHNRYDVAFPIGMYCDIPDDTGVYHKWIICDKEIANQFVKYLVLPVDYYLTWVERNGQERILRKMWGITRNQNSYTIGQYTDRYFTHPDNQDKIWFPLNPITAKFWYNSDTNKTIRLVVSAKTDNPTIWSVTKIENTKPIGLQKLTLYQTFWNDHTDYIERDSDGNITAMYADYYETDSSLTPTDPSDIAPTTINYSKITAATSTIKIAGSYKTLTAKIYNDSDTEITDNYSSADFKWTCSVGDEDLTDAVTWLNTSTFNQIKLKFTDDRSYLGKTLDIKCVVCTATEAIETTAQFELVV